MKYLQYKTYLAMIDRCENLELFRNFFIRNNSGEVVDLLEDGENSCASFVSNILYMNFLIKSPHATVDSTEVDLLNSGWQVFHELNQIEKGDLIIWKKNEHHQNRHLGIYLGNNKAVHNDKYTKKTKIEDINYRPIEKLIRHIKKDE